ncbi:MAG: AsmA family protein [Acidobacteriota bacterium]
MAKPRGCLSKLLLLMVIIGAAAVATPLLRLAPLKNAVELKLSEALGRRVIIDSARLTLIGGPYVTLTGMTAGEDPEFGEGTFLKANEVRADLDVIQYLRTRQIFIDSITLKSPQIDLVKNSGGVWSWTTLGRQSSEQSPVSRLVSEAVSFLSILSLAPGANLSEPTFRKIKIENASVKMIDYTGSKPSQVLYKNIVLNASLNPYAGGDARGGSQVKGELVVQSEEDGEADRFNATLPFDLRIDDLDASKLSVTGSVGPGPIETKNVSIGALAINGEINSNREAPLTGNGQMWATGLVIHTVNLSERVAQALKLDQIGDMSPGTAVASLETAFQISEGTFNTTGLRIQHLDGLGDATVPTGYFKIESALTVNYEATVVLSPEATLRVKSVSSTLGLVVTILETNNRVSVPINISGDVRNPEVQVDVSRIF